MDEFLMVKELVPFLDYENYPIVQNKEERIIAIGEQGLVAFRSPDNSLFCGNVEETLIFIRENQELISKSVTLRAQLNRIESAELQPSYDAWRKVADAVFDDPDQRRLWLDSELLIFQKQKQIWTEIDSVEIAQDKEERSSLKGSLTEYGMEFLVQWLSTRSNFTVKGWTAVWHHVNAIRPFDDRVAQIAVNWMYALGDEDTDLEQSKSILYALLQRNRSTDINWDELAGFISERFSAAPYIIFSFLRPRSLFLSLFVLLILHGFADDVLRLLEFCIQNVPKDDYIVDTLQYTLECMLSEWLGEDSSGQLPRDHDQGQIEQAWELLQQVRSLPNR
jgi:hypothetical protein